MNRFAWVAQNLLAAATLALLPLAAQASTAAYDELLASGATQEGIFSRIVIRNDIGLAGSAAFVADPAFAGVVALGWSGGQYCSGVLVSPTTVLSARHCGPLFGEQVRFGDSYNSPSFNASIQSVFYPAGGSANSPFLNGGDLSIVTLAQAVPGAIATPFMLSNETTSLIGSTVLTVGYGDRGLGSSGVTGWDGIRRGGSNVLDHYGAAVNTSSTIAGTANIFSTDFDNPSGSGNTLGWLGSDASATSYEATTAGGDSGGPLFAEVGGQWVLIGVLGGGTTNNSVYGDISWWTGVAPYQAQIEAAGGVFISAVPEPGSTAMLLLGLGVLVGRVRGRRSS
jgi:hypothetical protein